MKETLHHIADVLKNTVPEYKREGIPVVARVHGRFDGSVETYWLVVGQMDRSMMSFPHLKKYGRLINRNTNIATRILNSEVGTPIEYTTIRLKKYKDNHKIVAANKSDLINRSIELMDDNQKYIYTDLSTFIRSLQQNQRRIDEIEREKEELEERKRQAESAHEKGVITKGMNKLDEERRILTLQQEEMSKLTRFIREQGKLRFNPILDPIQNRIKTQNLYNGITIVIDGGPGTGKTTTMIQRLKYLTDWDAIEEDFVNGIGLYNLTAAQRDHLHQAIINHRDWMFFSPSELLKEYLKEAMNSEGLANTNAKVWNWREYRNKVVREYYLLIDPTNDNAPFKSSSSKERLFNNGSEVIAHFQAFFLEQLRQIKTRFPKLDAEGTRYRWVSIATGIQQRFEGCDGFSLQQFIQLFSTLEQLYRDDCRELLAENRERVKTIAEEIFVLCQEQQSLFDQLVDMARVQTIEQNEDEQEEQEPNEGNELPSEDVGSKVLPMIRIWFKRYCYNRKNSDAKLTARQEKLCDLLLPVLTEEHKNQMDRVGELALFEQFAKYTRGGISNIFGGFAAKYKRFRRQALSGKDTAWNLVELEALLKRREGKELHAQEQALLIGFINNLVKMLMRSTRQQLNHPFVSAYNELARPIIGIDEATDFNECDIYAMQSLLYNDYNSLTICGDLMQRLTATGITSWEDLDSFVDGMTVVDMRTSYRQSVSLLRVAQAMYKDTIGDEPNYKAYMKSSKVPEPLAFISTDEEEKIRWIEKRIAEVYLAYGKKLPSIAIFLNNKNDIRPFVETLRDTDFVIDAGVEVVDGSEGNVLASANQIRVYPIDVVKGMEFDVVFFHNIDQTTVNSDLIKRYIYVGVSRAAFFLGITLNSEKRDITKYFTTGADWSKI